MKNHLRSLLLAFGFSFVASSFTSSVEGREWTSTDGKKMKAIFLGIEGEKYKFKLANDVFANGTLCKVIFSLIFFNIL